MNAELPAERRMPLRLGVHFGKVLIEGDHVYGDDVNVAARVEDLAGKGGICLSGAAFDRVEGRIACGFEAYGPQRFKNMERPVRVYRLRTEPLMVGRVVPGKPPIPRSRRPVPLAGLVGEEPSLPPRARCSSPQSSCGAVRLGSRVPSGHDPT